MILAVSYKYRAGTLESLSNSWEEYIKTKAGKAKIPREKPKFKGKRNPITTIIHPNPNAGEKQPRSKDAVRVEGDKLVIPAFGKFKIKGIDTRWRLPDGTIPRVKVFKILKKASGYYVQLTGDFPTRRKLNHQTTALGVDFGLKEDNWVCASDGTLATSPRWFRKYEEKLAKAQQTLQLKIDKRLILWLNHPQTTYHSLTSIVASITLEQFEALKKCRTPDTLNTLVSEEVISNSQLQRLRYNAKFENENEPLSRSQEILKIKQRIARIHEKIKRARNAYQHYWTSRLIRRHGEIVVEDGLQRSKGKSKAKIEDGEFKENKRSANKGKNKSLSDAGIGGFIQKLETKGKESDRAVFRHHPAYSSQQCPICDHILREQKEIKDHPDYRCPECGYYHPNRDTKAGITLLLWQYLQGGISYELLDRYMKREIVKYPLDDSQKKQRWQKILKARAAKGGC